ncbi:MAG: DUF2478 domain-containing protein [Roseinatronobacter sp.]|nr:MAG: DUF2478 domain-containing protein [Roseinatronobacter sp.]
MLGYVTAEGRGAADKLLAELAESLHARGWPLAGVVQINRETRPDRHCDMDLCVLGHDNTLRISQDLGPHSRGCRLDPVGLENAVGLVEADLDHRPALLIINKFGKSEVEGRGFRAVIGKALSEGIPVLTSVNRNNLDGFLAYSADMAQAIAPSHDALLAWCEQTCTAHLA